MEKQLLFLLDYDLAINEDEIVHNFQPFLSQYSFDSPIASTSSPELPPTPVTPVRVLPQQATKRGRHQRVSSRGEQVYVAPPLDRSGSSSSLESDDMPLTPTDSASPPSPRRELRGKAPRSISVAQIQIQKPPAVYDAPTSASYSLPRSMTATAISSHTSKPIVLAQPTKDGFLGRLLRSDRRRRTRVEEEEEGTVAALSWAAI